MNARKTSKSGYHLSISTLPVNVEVGFVNFRTKVLF